LLKYITNTPISTLQYFARSKSTLTSICEFELSPEVNNYVELQHYSDQLIFHDVQPWFRLHTIIFNNWCYWKNQIVVFYNWLQQSFEWDQPYAKGHASIFKFDQHMPLDTDELKVIISVLQSIPHHQCKQHIEIQWFSKNNNNNNPNNLVLD
jgi:hypothetical protein